MNLLFKSRQRSPNSEPVPEQVAQLAQEVYQQQLMPCLLTVMPRVEFERQIGSRRPTVEYLRSHPTVVLMAFHGYDVPDMAMNTGLLLNEMVQHEPLAKILLYSDDVSCDAFKNLRDALLLHRTMAAEYLQQNYDTFFAMFTKLLDSSNYVTRRQSLKLLSELLVDRAHYSTMVRYVSSEENLKRIMNALRDRSKHIQLEAFHVFKVFVANPKKTPAVEAILRRNKARLLTFLQDFLSDRTDESFMDERQYILQIIRYVP
ncbi:unnamed protein product [Malassezia sympodialis ATCC 42132]|uniref:uncharacterized protein n=1 Tax=Malassezia sympodialis (strain ATCC 42132) TaxID=1230383 RepID=UPI0002C2BA78|nr:uncharacterized protein MSY001_1144 [Malassezia sympodialis ATCC 42132]CCU98438.1 unnamed protein product [Malassezia sympodialis ATCC 42132]|eukprot:XP_018739745.1 uncharacterized protein MSY001_1144 [Malassezia sympodialis ATCC 42132]